MKWLLIYLAITQKNPVAGEFDTKEACAARAIELLTSAKLLGQQNVAAICENADTRESIEIKLPEPKEPGVGV